MPRRTTRVPDDFRDEMRRLETELFLARQTILDLLPVDRRKLLDASYYCDTMSDFDEWMLWAVRSLVDLAEKFPGEEMGGEPGTFRARCPLCGDGAMSPDVEGFQLPGGLVRHLRGTNGSARCGVMRAVVEGCLESIRAHEAGEPRIIWEDRTPPWKETPVQPLSRPIATVIEIRRS